MEVAFDLLEYFQKLEAALLRARTRLWVVFMALSWTPEHLLDNYGVLSSKPDVLVCWWWQVVVPILCLDVVKLAFFGGCFLKAHVVTFFWGMFQRALT